MIVRSRSRSKRLSCSQRKWDQLTWTRQQVKMFAQLRRNSQRGSYTDFGFSGKWIYWLEYLLIVLFFFSRRYSVWASCAKTYFCHLSIWCWRVDFRFSSWSLHIQHLNLSLWTGYVHLKTTGNLLLQASKR